MPAVGNQGTSARRNRSVDLISVDAGITVMPCASNRGMARRMWKAEVTSSIGAEEFFSTAAVATAFS